MIVIKWSRFAYPWYWKPRLARRHPWSRNAGWAFRWLALYILTGDETSVV